MGQKYVIYPQHFFLNVFYLIPRSLVQFCVNVFGKRKKEKGKNDSSSNDTSSFDNNGMEGEFVGSIHLPIENITKKKKKEK
jgi:hypothetical protein